MSLCWFDEYAFWHVSPWVYPVWDSLCHLDLIGYFLFHVGEIFNYNLFKNFLIAFLSSSGTPIIWMLVHLILSQRFLRYPVLFILLLYYALQKLFQPFYLLAHWVIFLLQIFCYWFLLEYFFYFSDCVVSACLFFNSSRCLLIDSCILSILLSRFLTIFALIILNSFSGSLPISSSFIWNSVFLVYSFICVVFLCLFIIIIFLAYCAWGLLFPGFKVEFFLPFGFCPPNVGAMVCVSFV